MLEKEQCFSSQIEDFTLKTLFPLKNKRTNFAWGKTVAKASLIKCSSEIKYETIFIMKSRKEKNMFTLRLHLQEASQKGTIPIQTILVAFSGEFIKRKIRRRFYAINMQRTSLQEDVNPYAMHGHKETYRKLIIQIRRVSFSCQSLSWESTGNF